MKTTFTRTERLIAGLYSASFAVIGLGLTFIIFLSLDGIKLPLIAIVAVGGFLAGFLVMPTILKPDIFSIGRAIAAGCLTTLGAAFFTALFITLIFAAGMGLFLHLDLDLALNSGLTFSFSFEKFIALFPEFLFFALLFAIPYSFIGAPATVLFSHRFAKHRAKEPKFDLETFD